MKPVQPTPPGLEARLAQDLQTAAADAAATLLAQSQSAEQLIATAENAAGLAEAMTKKYLHPASPPVACKPGCSWCCYQLVPVSVPEVLRIVSFLRESLSPQEFAGTAERLRALDNATRGLTSQQRVSIPKPCAYLQDNQCTIYPVRPLACAEFTSYDVQVCKRGKRIGFKPGSVTHEKARLLAYSSVDRGLNTGLQRALPHADCESLELTAASVIALEKPEAAALWANGGAVFAPARLKRRAK